jgi:hypothetical protein
LKASFRLETLDVYSNPSIVNLSVSVGESGDGKVIPLAHCCNTDNLWVHGRIAVETRTKR